MIANQIIAALLSKCDASNWDAELFKGDEFRIRKEIYDDLHEFAFDWMEEIKSEKVNK